MDTTDRDFLYAEKIDNTYIKVHADPSVKKELYDYFGFRAKNAQFDPRVREKLWDGIVRLFNPHTSTIYFGNFKLLKKFCETRNYILEYDDSIDISAECSLVEAAAFMSKIVDNRFKPHDHQVTSLSHSLRKKRGIIVSPTASGKSFIIYSLVRKVAKRTLIIVPSIGLAGQMKGDFADYGFDVDTFVHVIAEGASKVTPKPIIISTWQALYTMPADYFKQFKIVIGDEAHEYDAKSIKYILENCTESEYRIGFTGTLDDPPVHQLVLEGLFGPIFKAASSRELIDKNIMANVLIKIITLKHPPKSFANYDTEIRHLTTNERRSKFIKNLALSLTGNVLILFDRVQDQGKPLFEMLQKEAGDRKCFFVDQTVDMGSRNDIRKYADDVKSSIVVASYRTFSRGVNIKHINHIIFASPAKKKPKVLQSIGRGLRIAEGKTHFILFDIADDFGHNTTLNHLHKRIEYYIQERFDMKHYKIDFGDTG